MTLAQRQIVDWLGIEKGSGAIVLTIADEADWNDVQTHLQLLETKLNTYIAFVESGEVFQRVHEEFQRSVPSSTPIKVEVVAQFAVPVEAQPFFHYARKTLEAIGVEMTWRLVSAAS